MPYEWIVSFFKQNFDIKYGSKIENNKTNYKYFRKIVYFRFKKKRPIKHTGKIKCKLQKVGRIRYRFKYN